MPNMQATLLLALGTLTLASPVAELAQYKRAVIDPYAPIPALCPSTPLVRPATSINSNEAAYVKARKALADPALAAWLKKQGKFNTTSLPAVGMTSSGGGDRALLEAAGVTQAFDARDSSSSVAGIYQSLTYQAGLSGGSWYLSSLAGNNWPTISYLQKNLWDATLAATPLLPANLFSIADDTEYLSVIADLEAKQLAGYPTTIVDAWGRLLSYQFLQGTDGGVATRLSGLTSLSNFTSHNVPFPIITTTVVNAAQGACYPALNATIFEFSPYEYGAWDKGIAAFAQTKYMGSKLKNGKPSTAGVCTVHYDNLGYVMGTSSDVFNAACEVVEPILDADASLTNVLEGFVNKTHVPVFDDLFGLYPNPFYQYPVSTSVESLTTLTLADGGESDQNNPIWPFLQPYRSVDVLIVNDNSADSSENWPNGTEILQTYENAQAAGLTKMPYIPSVETIVSEGLNKRATFFGCNETGTVFMVWLPNTNYVYASNTSTEMLAYTPAETAGMIDNGNAIATQNGTAGWPFCLACAIKHGDGAKLPAGCNACFEKYCYYK